jgi:lysophospholipid acyltransferase (LPLAT)-like uncharacterized protein
MKLGWFDIKTKFKKIIRSIFYAKIGQELVCYLIIGYVKLVILTSKKIFIGEEKVVEKFKNNQPLILAAWHNRIMMSPMFIGRVRKINKNKKLASLASKHGDGRFVGRVMEKFGAINISGSSRDGRKASRGIDMHGLKEIFHVLKHELGVAITPDGPRGPACKINGAIIKIAELSQVPIMPIGIGYSNFFELNTWDKFRFPKPFGVICYYYGDFISVNKHITEEEIQKLNLFLEEQINLATTAADKAAQSIN